jgi:hypothetical protein
MDRSFLEAALVGFRHRLSEITLKKSEIKQRLGGPTAPDVAAPMRRRRKRKPMSASARKKIAAAQRKRWAAVKVKGTAKAGRGKTKPKMAKASS